jgi:hypothetical protein
MKTIALAFLLTLFTFQSSFSQNISDLEAFEKAMKPGVVLTYDVAMGETRYQLIATIIKLGEEIVFDWETTSPAGKKGTVSMSAATTSTADALNTDFSGGEKKLDKETMLFISKKIFNEVSNDANADLKIAGASDTLTLMSNTISEFNFNLNGNLIAIPGWELEGGSEIAFALHVVESVKFPLIIKTDFGWTMQLIEIKNP